MREVNKTTNHQKALEQVLRTFIPLLSRNSNTTDKPCVLLNTNSHSFQSSFTYIISLNPQRHQLQTQTQSANKST